MTVLPPAPAWRLAVPIVTWALALLGPAPLPATAGDRLKELQAANVATKAEKASRPYHFGSQGPGDVFSNHASHSNRLIPVYVFGRKADLGAVTGERSVYRDPDRLRTLYGRLPENTVNPGAEYADQSDLYRVQRDAVARGARHLFIVWFDGMDWPTTQAAAIAKTGRVYAEGKGSGLLFQDYRADGSAQFGYYVTSPTHDNNDPDVDAQTVVIPADSLAGGYDARIAGPNPWTLGPLGPGAGLPEGAVGQQGRPRGRGGRRRRPARLHRLVAERRRAGQRGQVVQQRRQRRRGGSARADAVPPAPGAGVGLGTVTSVPFDHVSPAAMYAHNVDRDDYQDLAREMLGLRGITQDDGKEGPHPGLDVVIGAGFGQETTARSLQALGRNGVAGNLHIADADKRAIDVRHGGKYVVAQTERGVNGAAGPAGGRRAGVEGGPPPVRVLRREGVQPPPVPDRRRRLRPRPRPRRQGREVHQGRP